MDLGQYEGQFVFIVGTNNKAFRGLVTNYFYPEDNEDGKESIAINDSRYNNLIEFNEDDIKTIKIIK
ncbi:MAG: hypothetical protein Q4A67_01980 [Aerococcus sp.]|nr:hypothetical protein [Aerococcus sp.]